MKRKKTKPKEKALLTHISITTEDVSKRRVEKLENGWIKVTSYVHEAKSKLS